MSYGMAYPSISAILPTIAYPTPASAGFPTATDVPGTSDVLHHAAGSLPHDTFLQHGASHAVDGAQAAASHALDAAGHALQELVEPALVALGALSGALFVGRAAMVTTHVLAAAAVRAADEQRCLERGQRIAAAATAQWEAAVFATVRANGRRAALLARIRRTAGAALPDTPRPPLPDLPPPLHCNGARLGELRAELAVMEKALCDAEAAHASWTMEQATHAANAPDDEDWRRRMLARREAAVRAHEADPTAAGPAALPQPPGAEGLGRTQAEESGAELLALLEPGADAKDAELAVAAVRHAVECAAERPAKARSHLREARRFVTDANRAVRDRIAAQEKAAVQLDFLLTEAPPGEPELTPAAEEIALLRKALEQGRPLTPDEQRAVDRQVTRRLTDLEDRYTRELLRRAVARFADPAAADAGASGGAEAPACFDLTPAGWWPGHWLRVTVREGRTELVTMYEEHPGPRGPADLALDARRCHEARGHLEELREAGRRWGLDLPVSFTESGSAVPGVRGGDGAVVLEMADPEDREHERERTTAPGTATHRPAGPKARSVSDDRRRTG
ncbi:hypothetical protein ACFWAR_10165 [Streptomyces sp. NPDC059917]|uniref:hypothetical protein n=1 Tax=Streptomyces sp. NPDC059917 TaxID=3347002 RepID=UPI003655F9DA